MSGTLTVLVGLPGSGKTTLARKLVAEDKDHKTIRINRDDLRKMAFDAYVLPMPKDMEPLITLLEEVPVKALLRRGMRVVIDAVNIHDYTRDLWRKRAEEVGAEFEVIFLDVDAETCIARDEQRFIEDGVRRVGREVIERMAHNLDKVKDNL